MNIEKLKFAFDVLMTTALIAVAVVIMLTLTGCVSHKYVPEVEEVPAHMKMVASVKEVTREQAKLTKGRQVAGMDYYITTDPIEGDMNFQYRGLNGSVMHQTKPEVKLPKKLKRKIVYRTKVDKKDAEILKALIQLNQNLERPTPVRPDAHIPPLQNVTPPEVMHTPVGPPIEWQEREILRRQGQ